MELIRRLFCGGSSDDIIQKRMTGAKLNLRVDSVNQEKYNPSFFVDATIISFKPSKEETQTTEETKCCEAVEDKEEVMGEEPTVKMNCSDSKKVEFKYMDKFSDLALRVLLIDDKIGPSNKIDKDNIGGEKVGKDNQVLACAKKEFNDIKNDYTIEVKKCDDDCPQKAECKLRTVKDLMEYRSTNAGKEDVFHYWKQHNIDTYYCPTVIKDFIEDNDKLGEYDGIRFFKKDSGEKEKIKEEENKENKKFIKIECDFAPQIDRNDLKVQIIGVRDVRTAILLMCKFKFDMVFCDHLLDYKDENNGERDYAKQLFDFLSYDYKGKIKNKQEPSKKKRLEVLEQLCRDVLDNRGPLDKLWIMPITGFNQTFIQDLYRNQIDLIGHKWNISNGADPITTPWQFLYHLNKFIELQLKQCVYDMEHLLRFLLYTCEDLDDKLKKGKDHGDFYAFQAFMGSEYANFMRRYGNRHIIQRDAFRNNKDEMADKSVFATYIWNKFYANPSNRDVIELNRLIQRFLYQAATMHDDLEGQQGLDDAFGHLCHFIDNNQIINSNKKYNIEQLDEHLEHLRAYMEKLTDNKRKKIN